MYRFCVFVVNRVYNNAIIEAWIYHLTVSGGAMSNIFGSSKGKPTTSVTDYYKREACEERQSDDRCIETCIANELENPTRPKYGVGPSGTDCQEYTEDVVRTCEKRCVRR